MNEDKVTLKKNVVLCDSMTLYFDANLVCTLLHKKLISLFSIQRFSGSSFKYDVAFNFGRFQFYPDVF